MPSFSLIQSKIPFGVIFLPIVYYAESRQKEHFGTSWTAKGIRNWSSLQRPRPPLLPLGDKKKRIRQKRICKSLRAEGANKFEVLVQIVTLVVLCCQMESFSVSCCYEKETEPPRNATGHVVSSSSSSLESVRCSLCTTMMKTKKAKPHGGLSAGQVALTLKAPLFQRWPHCVQ